MEPEELKRRRENLGMTQQQLADLLGVNQMTVSRWERDERGIPPYLHLALQTIERDSRGRSDKKALIDRLVDVAAMPGKMASGRKMVSRKRKKR